jgi:hypothetical protein
VEQVLSHYGPNKIYYTAHTYPLWLHRQAYTVAQVRHAMRPAPRTVLCTLSLHGAHTIRTRMTHRLPRSWLAMLPRVRRW